ncbi:MAG TPA: hypothetical protein VFI38_00260 [Candidatus Acidoferrum sp.]|nr:hypothetical protein [Candidatus Acidoferrum sp.]
MNTKLLAAGLFFLGGVISTNAQTKSVRVQVPFEFEIADKHLPAGEYVVSSDHDQVWLSVYHGNNVAVVQSNRTVRDGGNSGKVVFNCYQKLCFLSQLWLRDADGSRQILTSKAEQQAAKHAQPQQLALLAKPSNLANTN